MSQSSILFSRYLIRSVSGEQFIAEHMFLYQLSGSLIVNDGTKEYVIPEGSFSFARRNRLAKYIKQPPAKGEFKSISVHFDQDFLKTFSRKYGDTAHSSVQGDTITVLKANPLFESYIHSLTPYFNASTDTAELFALKTKEAVLILLKTNPELKDVLFDFSEPGKLDLEAFMNRNFHFNVSMRRFAYLTGRSLTSFKRDFQNVFQTSPGRWLLQKRLQEAYYLISKKRKKPSQAYLEVGFEDLSHFSYAFKKTYGITPSQLTETQPTTQVRQKRR